jgi:hypothetical protein
VNPRTSERFPSWNIQTIEPKVADSDSRFKTTALAGTKTDPNIKKRTTKVTTPMMASASGRSPIREALISTREADSPVTPTATGAPRRRTSATRSSASPLLGSTAGMALR